MTDEVNEKVLRLTAEIVAAHAGNNQLAGDALPTLIRSVYDALSRAGTAEAIGATELVPAVPIKKSVFPGYIVCLEDGAKLKMMKRYLKTRYDLSPEQYREKWNLPQSYPMVAPEYANKRSALAKELGLGRKGQPAKIEEAKASVRRAKG